VKHLAGMLILLLVLPGCAKRSTSRFFRSTIPRNCITKMQFADKSVCHPLQDGRFVCDGLILQADCVQVQPIKGR
jgi:hypothetical protein